MAVIQQGAPEEGRRGNISGLIYYRVGDRTLVRSSPSKCNRVKKNQVRKNQMSMFTMIKRYCQAHYKVFQYTFDREGTKTPANFFHQYNHEPLKRAFAELYERHLAGDDVLTITEMDLAVNRYAQEHPDEIFLAYRKGYQPVMFNGTWPDAITLYPEVRGSLPTITISL